MNVPPLGLINKVNIVVFSRFPWILGYTLVSPGRGRKQGFRFLKTPLHSLATGRITWNTQHTLNIYPGKQNINIYLYLKYFCGFRKYVLFRIIKWGLYKLFQVQSHFFLDSLLSLQCNHSPIFSIFIGSTVAP